MVLEPIRSFAMSLTEGQKKLWKSRHSLRIEVVEERDDIGII